jgi:hypothetical protein
MARHGRSSLNVGVGVFPPAGGDTAGVTYNDSCTGTITLSGTRVEGKVGTDARSGQITLTGTRVEGKVGRDSPTGTVFLTGTGALTGGCLQPSATTYPATNTFPTSAVCAGGVTYSDSPTGTIFLTGTRVEVFSPTYNDDPIGTIYLWGAAASAQDCLYTSLETFPSADTYPVEPCPPGADPVLSWLRVREKPSLNQSVMVTTPNGKTYRWGEDDPVPERSFHSLAYGSGMPGGFDQMTATLPRKRGVDYSDLELFSNIQVFDAGGEVTGEYRLDSAPVTAGNEFVITPNAVGYQAALEDRKDCAALFVDIDFSHWGGISTQYRIAAASTPYTEPSVVPDPTTGQPSVATIVEVPMTDALAEQGWCAAHYDAGSHVDIGSIYYAWTKHPNTPLSALAPAVEWEVWLDSSDVFPSADQSGNLRAAGPGTGTLTSTASDNRFGYVQYYTFDAPNPGVDEGIFWTMLAVYGEHGLTKRGSASATTAQGFWASDVLEYIISTFTSLNVGTIDVTSFVIPQLEFRTPTTPAEMVKQANRFHLHDWFVGPGQKFHYRERGTYGRHWLARVGPAKLEGTGQTTERCVTDVLITYQDVDGTAKTVGPTGSGADATDASLHDSDTQNPAIAAGVERWAILDMGQVSTSAAAIQVGARFLEEVNALDHSGRAELTGHVMNDAGVLFPYSSVQAGDTITFMDAADTSERRIVKATKGANTVSIDLDAPPEGTQALLERLGVQWTNLSALGAPSLDIPLYRPALNKEQAAALGVAP